MVNQRAFIHFKILISSICLTILGLVFSPFALAKDNNACSSLFVVSPSSKQITQDFVHIAQVSGWWKWTLEDYKKLAYKVLKIPRSNPNFAEENFPQEVLLLKSFPKEEQILIKKLLNISQLKKFKSRDAIRRFNESFPYYLGVISRMANPVPRDTATIMAQERASESPGVEIGAWLVRTKSNTYTAIYTSSNSEMIYGTNSTAALNKMLNAHSIRHIDIIEVSFFHTHPNGGPLSKEDYATAKAGIQELKRNNIFVPYNMYAIVSVEGEPIVFHSGLLVR